MKNFIEYTFLLSLLLLSGLVNAETNLPKDIYFVIGIGSTDVTTDNNDFYSTSTSTRFGAGKQLDNSTIAIEGYFINYGEACDLGYCISGSSFAGQALYKNSISEKADLIIKLGLASWDGTAAGTDESGTDIFYGIGIQNKIDDKISIRISYEGIAMETDNDTIYADTLGARLISTF